MKPRSQTAFLAWLNTESPLLARKLKYRVHRAKHQPFPFRTKMRHKP